MTLADLLAALGERRTGKPFALDANGVCQIDFRGGRRIAIEPDPEGDRAYLYGRVAGLPARNHAVVYGKLLLANLHGHYTDDAWFALDAEAEEIVLNRTLWPARLDPDAFEAVVTGFMDMVELWSRELASPGFDAAEGEGESEVPPAAFRPELMIRG
jgi:hypothetical protein